MTTAIEVGSHLFGVLATSSGDHEHDATSKSRKHKSKCELVSLTLPYFTTESEFGWGDCLGDGMDDFRRRKRGCETAQYNLLKGSLKEVVKPDPSVKEEAPEEHVIDESAVEGRTEVEAQPTHADKIFRQPQTTLSKKEQKKRELEELDAIFEEMGIELHDEAPSEPPTAPDQNESTPVGETSTKKKKRKDKKKAKQTTVDTVAESVDDTASVAPSVKSSATRRTGAGGAKAKAKPKSTASSAKSAAAKAAAEAKARKNKKKK